MNPRTFPSAASGFPHPAGILLSRIAGLLLLLRLALPSCADEPAATHDGATGRVRLADGQTPILVYQHGVNAPGELLQRISPDNRKYAITRSDYLHPLHGPEGEALTLDWPIDHPHHRGIYWAWPEVDCRGSRSDLHALQNLFAHPVGNTRTFTDALGAGLVASNVWIRGIPAGQPRNPDNPPVLLETVAIHAGNLGPNGRPIDLMLRFEALEETVSVARRGTDLYGGLNLRFAPIRNPSIRSHTDSPDANPRAAWGQIGGTFGGATRPATVLILQHPGNPEYPGDWVQYPELNWLQPTFPAAGHRFRIEPGRPLVLSYRLWIRAGNPASDDIARRLWNDFAQTSVTWPSTQP